MVTKVHAAIIATIVGSLILYIGLRLGAWSMSAIDQVILYVILGSIVAALGYGFGDTIKNRFEKKPQDVEKPLPFAPDTTKYNKDNLLVVYLRKRGFPDSPEYTLRRYIGNSSNGLAYSIREIPESLASDIKEHKIEWRGYNDINSLRNFLRLHYTVYETEPLRRHLGSENWKVRTIINDIKKRQLKGLSPLEKLEVRILTRRYFFSVKKRTVIIYSPNDGSKAQVWQSPSYINELVREGVIEHNVKGMRFWQNLERWSKSNGYIFVDRFYPVITLLVKGS
jgi:hypothetical protein